MSSLGMNLKGEVRSASEFKQIYEDTGVSSVPYRCPFCEVDYEDRCIVTVCVKAPHFKLPNGTDHRNGCTGEAGDGVTAVASAVLKAPKRKVVGDIDLPESLVKRRKPSFVRKAGDVGHGQPPDAAEVTRRRKLLATDQTISAHFTTSHLRPIAHAYKLLREQTGKQAASQNLGRGTSEYNAYFREVLAAYRLSLYGQKLTYGTSFQNSNLVPGSVERIYFGRGKVQIESGHLIIKDGGLWPTVPKSKDNLLPFDVTISRTPEIDAPTSHQRMLDALERIAAAGQSIEWYAYGAPARQDEKFELALDSLDHLYWIELSNR